MPIVDADTRNAHYILLANLENERSTFIAHWRELAEYLNPRRTRFFITDVNRGDKRHNKIVDSTATLALRTLQSGMMSGKTSPARQWFRLSVPDSDLAEFPPVKEWLSFVEKRMFTVFARSNLYNKLPVVYGDMGGLGTAAMFIEEDFQDVVRFYSLPLGSFSLSTNDRGVIDVFSRQFSLSVREVVQKFGRDPNNPTKIIWDDISREVRRSWDLNQHDQRVEIDHIIEPNPDWDPDKLESRFKRYLSSYFERGISQNKGASTVVSGGSRDLKYLRISGYDFFPVLAPRWEVAGQDIYGTNCPGMTALGDIKSLQLMHKRKSQGIEKMVTPPLMGHSDLKTSKVSILPGDITYLPDRALQQGGLKPVFEINPRIAELSADIQEHQFRIRRTFFEDLFLMIATLDRRKQITAREIDERSEEKLLALGPVMEQLDQDLLDPLIDITFGRMLEQDLIPVPPEELQGQELKVEYISPLDQAQKLINLRSINNFTGFASALVQINPETLDKIDTDQLLDVYGEMVSLPPKILRSDEEVVAIRQKRAQAQQAQQLMESLQQGAGAAKDLSQASVSEDNVLGQLASESEVAGNA